MPDLPAPPVPSDLDLSGLEYMPLLVVRLRRSRAWLRAKRRPELGFYMMNLWMAAWMECPAGSLEDDDDVLADAAMCPIGQWQDIKRQVMDGFEKCADGRLYHRVLVEQALRADKKRGWWRESKRRQRAEKQQSMSNRTQEGQELDASRMSNDVQRYGTGRDGTVSRERESAPRTHTPDPVAARDAAHANVNGPALADRQAPLNGSHPAPGVSASANEEEELPPTHSGGFFEFWQMYPLKQARGLARPAYAAVIDAKRATHEQIMAGLARYLAKHPVAGRWTMRAHRWLEGECWLDEDPPDPVERAIAEMRTRASTTTH